MKFRIGEFSKLAKVSVKTLRHYDEEGILMPGYVDGFNHYRYYRPEQLADLRGIVAYRRAGLSIDDIRRMRSEDPAAVMRERKAAIQAEAESLIEAASLIDGLMEGVKMDMEYQVETKEIAGGIVAYRRGRIDSFANMTEFVLGFREKCLALNPGLECVEDGYCFVTYDDKEYKERDIGLEYVQLVKTSGVSGGEIGFRELKPIVAACVRHVGPFNGVGAAYAAAAKWVSENGMDLVESPRECYIDGPWNKEDPSEYMIEVQFPIGYL